MSELEATFAALNSHLRTATRIDIHLHLPDGSGAQLAAKLDHISAQITAMAQQGAQIMSTVTSIKQLVTDLDAETNAVAAKIDAQIAAIQALKDQIAAGGVATQADLDAITDGLTPISARLLALGASATDPIPAEG